MKNWLTIFYLFISLFSFSQQKQVMKMIEEGNAYYKKNEFAKAAEMYTKAVAADPSNNTAKFNQANAYYQSDKKTDAAIIFAEVANTSIDKEIRSQAFYNKGVILTQQKNLDQSIEAYKNALRNNSDDQEARENLQKALLELKKKNAEKKKEDGQQKKKKEDQKEKPASKMNPKEVEQLLKLLQQKEKEVQQRVQKEKTKKEGSPAKDW